ncbi:hypothetical protein [Lentzea guizhouensis]|uniref:hypothetical protein n=1 Tax=Lentzea guizhouensis TaxID=1586287 RepID=UPI0012B69D28|nr:hypothetical protein [Lentzea guizhouensis]
MKTERTGSAKPDRTAQHWAGRYASATTPAAQAAVEWDRARAAVRDLPEQQQKQAWRELAAKLRDIALGIEAGPRDSR